MQEYYLWIKVVHIVFFTSWMAGLFYAPRLFVYHAENIQNIHYTDIVKVQEYKLLHYITIPAMWITIIAGGLLIYMQPDFFKQPWFHAKLTFALILFFYTFSLQFFYKQFQNSTCKKSGKFFRIYNEVSTLVFIAIIVLVVIRPTFS